MTDTDVASHETFPNKFGTTSVRVSSSMVLLIFHEVNTGLKGMMPWPVDTSMYARIVQMCKSVLVNKNTRLYYRSQFILDMHNA